MGKMTCQHVPHISSIQPIETEGKIIEIGADRIFWPKQIHAIEKSIQTYNHGGYVSARKFITEVFNHVVNFAVEITFWHHFSKKSIIFSHI